MYFDGTQDNHPPETFRRDVRPVGKSGDPPWRRFGLTPPDLTRVRNDFELPQSVHTSATRREMSRDPFLGCELRHPNVTNSENKSGLPTVEPRVVDKLLHVRPRVLG